MPREGGRRARLRYKKRMSSRALVLVAVASLGSTACYGRVGIVPAILGTAIVTAAVISATEPPRPRVVYMPPPRDGYAWQPGYWTRQDDQWVWVEGQWLPVQQGYAWSPTHWERDPDGNWRLIPGRWLPDAPPPPPP